MFFIVSASGITRSRMHPIASRTVAALRVQGRRRSPSLVMTNDSSGGGGRVLVKEPDLETKEFVWSDAKNVDDGQQYRIAYSVGGKESATTAVLLIHGFGINRRHWRGNVGPLMDAGYRVYAVDLLGFGDSEKPLIQYSLDVWQRMILEFMRMVQKSNPLLKSWVLVGNSIGSLISLMTARELLTSPVSDSSRSDPEVSVSGVAMFNCAGGLTSFRYSELSPPLAALLWLVKSLLFNSVVGPFYFERFRTPENIRSVLRQVYTRHDRIDDELLDMIHEPSNDPNACKVFLNILNADAGPTPKSILATLPDNFPILTIWGENDPWTPLRKGLHPGEQFPEWHPSLKLEVLPDASHCPHDDDVELANSFLLDWLQETRPADSPATSVS